MVFFEELADYLRYNVLVALCIAFIFLFLTWSVPKIIKAILLRIGFTPHYSRVIEIWISAILLAFGAYWVLRWLGADPVPILGIYGLVTLAISLGLNSILQNYFAGLAIKTDAIVTEGDTIEIDGVKGIVLTLDSYHMLLYNDTNKSFYKIPNVNCLLSIKRILNPDERVLIAGDLGANIGIAVRSHQKTTLHRHKQAPIMS